MLSAPLPPDEAERLQALREYAVLDTMGDTAFDDLTALASHICGVPIALVSLIDEKRQWFLSRHGLDATETPRDYAFCAHAILGPGPFVVPDAHADVRFADNPLVQGDPHVRFYAGTPLVTPRGQALGTLCVIDHEARTLTADQFRSLETLGRQVVAHLELRKASMRIRASEARFRSMAMSMQTGIILQDTNSKIVWSNQAARDLLGVTVDQLEGRTSFDPTWQVIHEDGSDFPGHTHPVVQALATAKEVRGVVMGVFRPVTRDRAWLQVDAIPQFDEFGQLFQALCTFVDITPRKNAEDDARAKSIQNRSLLSSSPLAIIATGLNGIIHTFNEAAERLLGFSAEEMIGRLTPSVFHDPDEVAARAAELSRELGEPITPGFDVIVTKALHNLPDEQEWTYIRKDGARVPVSVSVTVVRDTAGTPIGFMGIATDIAARKQTAAALVAAKELAEEAARTKSDFLATMSHEIRTPMNGVLGMTHLLSETPLSAEQRGYTDAIGRSAQSLMGVINDVLDFSKIEAGKLLIEPIPFALELAVVDVSELLAPGASTKGVEFLVQVHPDVPSRVIGDSGRLRQVLFNLAGNAIKFTETGHVMIDVTRAKRSGANVVRFEISDTGIGIPAAIIPRLFSAFTQADASTARRFGGTGLGLSICRRLVELMGGTIGVTSVEGEGSTFWFELGLAEDHTTPPILIHKASLDGVRVLVVDNVPVSVELMRALLAARGARVSSASNGPDALAKLRQAATTGDPFRAAVVDFRMPEMDGAALGRIVRADDTLKDIKLVLATAAGARGDAVRFHGIGFNAYLTKPLHPGVLVDAVATLVARAPGWSADEPLVTRHSIEESGAHERTRQTSHWAPIDPGTPFTRVLLAEDNPVNQVVAVKMLERLHCRVDVVADGAEAVDMASRFSYDVIFMDVQMPIVDGLEATRRIRRLHSAAANTRIIAMTANAMEGDREACLASGMNDFVSKPIVPATLRTALESARAIG